MSIWEMTSPILLWEADRCCRPLSGLANWNGQIVWFTVKEYGGWEILTADQYIAMNDDERKEYPVEVEGNEFRICKDRTYSLIELIPSELEYLQKIRHKYRELMGSNAEHEPGISQPADPAKQRPEQFYSWLKQQPSIPVRERKTLAVVRERDFVYFEPSWRVDSSTARFEYLRGI